MPLELTPIGDWKLGERVQLPSGKVVELVNPDVLSMLTEDGDVFQMFMQLAKDKEKKQALAQPENLADEMVSMGLLGPFIKRIVKGAFNSPRIVEDETKENGIELKRVSMTDQIFVMNWALGRVAQLEPFHQEPSGTLAIVPNGKDDGDTA